MLVYATVEDLTAELGATTPEDPAPYLRAASALVRQATRRAVYDTTATGAPSDPDVAEAFRDATTAQVRAWVELGVDPRNGPAGVTGAPQSSSIGSASVTYGAREGADVDRIATLSELVPAAADFLADVLANDAVWVY